MRNACQRNLCKAAVCAAAACFLIVPLCGCLSTGEQQLGAVFAASPTFTPVKEAMSAPKAQTMVLHGKMIEKCPTAACWFNLDDGTGRIKVDLKSTNFTVAGVSTGTTITVSGKLDRSGDEPTLEATGIRW